MRWQAFVFRGSTAASRSCDPFRRPGPMPRTAQTSSRPDPPRTDPAERRRASRIYAKLAERYPGARCALRHDGPWQLLVATILSAQCTDAHVNKVTPRLFAAWPTPRAAAEAGPEGIEPYVKTCGFFRNKAKSIHGAARVIMAEHGGEVPRTMDELLALPGVARKTANVVLGNAFDTHEGVVVDTHVGRLAVRLGFTEHPEKNAVKIERDLMARFPRSKWTPLSHLLIEHGRRVCKARGPKCGECVLRRSCPKIGVEPPPARERPLPAR